MIELLSSANTWWHVLGYFGAVFFPAPALYWIGVFLWRSIASDGKPQPSAGAIDSYHRRDLPAIVGGLERVLYVASWLVGRPEFIGVWLALKIAGGWKAWYDGRDVNGVHIEGRYHFNVFLIGCGLSVLNALTAAKAIEWLCAGDGWRALLVAGATLSLTYGLWAWCAIRWHCGRRAA